MADKLIYIPNDNTQCMDTQLNKIFNQDSINSPRLLGQQITKRFYKNFQGLLLWKIQILLENIFLDDFLYTWNSR